MRAAAGLALLLIATPAYAAPLKPGDLVVIDTNAKAIVHVDPETGARRTITKWAQGSDPTMGFPWGIKIEASGRILISDMNRSSSSG